MDFKGKLARLRDAGPGSLPISPSPEIEPVPASVESAEEAARLAKIERLRGLIKAVIERDAPLEPRIEEREIELDVRGVELPGSLRETEHGTVHVAEELLEPHHCQGRQLLSQALRISPRTLAELAYDPSLEAVDPSGMLLLDTETTGLVGGTGTVPFLIGLGWFEDQSLRIEQLFLRDLGQELPMLRWLTERLERSTMLVTYNGKTFDWPLIRTRYVMNQLPIPATLPHLDLLHCARRVYKRRLGEVRLVHVEEKVLGMRREDDVEGFEIPIRYLDYLRTGKTARLVPVVEHNAHDVVSLAAVLARLGERYERLELTDEPQDHLGYAKIALRAGRMKKARDFLQAAAAGGGGRALTVEALMLEAQLARKQDDLDAEEGAFHEALAEAAGDVGLAAVVHLALAKLCEHRRKDLYRALDHASRTFPAETVDACTHRTDRLMARIARQAKGKAAKGGRLGLHGDDE